MNNDKLSKAHEFHHQKINRYINMNLLFHLINDIIKYCKLNNYFQYFPPNMFHLILISKIKQNHE